jgi:hypothetical protein
MSYEYKSINFISNPVLSNSKFLSSNDARIKFFNKNNKLTYSIESETSYFYCKNNCIIIKIINKNDIILTFENKTDANLAMIKLLNIISIFNDNIPSFNIDIINEPR